MLFLLAWAVIGYLVWLHAMWTAGPPKGLSTLSRVIASLIVLVIIVIIWPLKPIFAAYRACTKCG